MASNNDGPLNQVVSKGSVDLVDKFSPTKPLHGTYVKSDSLNPACLVKNVFNLA